MQRIVIVCEGRTEQRVLNLLLYRHLVDRGIDLSTRLIGPAGKKGGNVNYIRLRNDLQAVLNSDKTVYCTSFIDYYGLSESFPGKEPPGSRKSPAAKFELLCKSLNDSLAQHLRDDQMRRFIPYVQLYELEGLFFGDLNALARVLPGVDRESLQSIRNAFDTPEAINDSQETAPSKRLAQLHPPYHKVIHGERFAQEARLDHLLSSCPLFAGWVNVLEKLPVL